MLTAKNLIIAGVVLLLIIGGGLWYLNHGNQPAPAVDPSTQVGMVPPAGGPPAPVAPPAETTPPPAEEKAATPPAEDGKAADTDTKTPPPAAETEPAPKSEDEAPAPTEKEEAAAKADAASPRYIAQVRADLDVATMQEAKHAKRYAFLLHRAGLQPSIAKAEEWLKGLDAEGEVSHLMPSPAVGKFFWGSRTSSPDVFTTMDISKVDSDALTGVVIYLDDTPGEGRFVSFQLGEDGGHYLFVGQCVAGKNSAEVADIGEQMRAALADPSAELVSALDGAIRQTAWAQSVEARLTELGKPAPAQ